MLCLQSPRCLRPGVGLELQPRHSVAFTLRLCWGTCYAPGLVLGWDHLQVSPCELAPAQCISHHLQRCGRAFLYVLSSILPAGLRAGPCLTGGEAEMMRGSGAVLSRTAGDLSGTWRE